MAMTDILCKIRILDIFMAIPGSGILLFFFGIGNQTTYRTCVWNIEWRSVGEAAFETQNKVLILWVPPPGKGQ